VRTLLSSVPWFPLPKGTEVRSKGASCLTWGQADSRDHACDQMSLSLQALFHMQSVKCLKCQEQTRAVLPCQHAVLCELCAEGSECPVCQPSRAHTLQS
jgi:hypothetical protein